MFYPIHFFSLFVICLRFVFCFVICILFRVLVCVLLCSCLRSCFVLDSILFSSCFVVVLFYFKKKCFKFCYKFCLGTNFVTNSIWEQILFGGQLAYLFVCLLNKLPNCLLNLDQWNWLIEEQSIILDEFWKKNIIYIKKSDVL